MNRFDKYVNILNMQEHAVFFSDGQLLFLLKPYKCIMCLYWTRKLAENNITHTHLELFSGFIAICYIMNIFFLGNKG